MSVIELAGVARHYDVGDSRVTALHDVDLTVEEGEFLVVLASYRANFWYAFLAATILMLGAGYTLWLVKRVVFGPVGNERVAAMRDVNGREFVVLGLLALSVLLLGLWPAPLLEVMRPTIEQLVQQMMVTKL